MNKNDLLVTNSNLSIARSNRSDSRKILERMHHFRDEHMNIPTGDPRKQQPAFRQRHPASKNLTPTRLEPEITYPSRESREAGQMQSAWLCELTSATPATLDPDVGRSLPRATRWLGSPSAIWRLVVQLGHHDHPEQFDPLGGSADGKEHRQGAATT
jgi:hypothetical protein